MSGRQQTATAVITDPPSPVGRPYLPGHTGLARRPAPPHKMTGMRSARVAVALDIACVLVFVIIGRASHTKGESVAGIASTAWPFLAGLAIGWLAARAWRQPAGLFPAGVGAWLGTVALGMVFRVVSGQGTAFAFILVALAFLGLVLLGWRLAIRLGGRMDRGQPGRPQARIGILKPRPRS